MQFLQFSTITSYSRSNIFKAHFYSDKMESGMKELNRGFCSPTVNMILYIKAGS